MFEASSQALKFIKLDPWEKSWIVNLLVYLNGFGSSLLNRFALYKSSFSTTKMKQKEILLRFFSQKKEKTINFVWVFYVTFIYVNKKSTGEFISFRIYPNVEKPVEKGNAITFYMMFKNCSIQPTVTVEPLCRI